MNSAARGRTGAMFAAISLAALFAATPSDAAPQVTVTRTPALIRQLALPSAPRESTTLTLTNAGDASTFVRLTASADFFTHSPDHVTLEPGKSQLVTIIAGTRAASLEPTEGYSIPTGNGVPPGMKIPVKVHFYPLSAIVGENDIRPERPRVEVSAPASVDPTGTITVRNTGTPNRAFVTSDSLWLVPDSAVSVPEDGNATLGFRVIRSQRPDAPAVSGSVTGSISLAWQTESGPKGGYASSFSVLDTVRPVTTAGTIPPLPAGEIALFIPGVGNVTGSGGKQFVSDISILNPSGAAYASDVRLHYLSASGAASILYSLGTISPDNAVAIADVVRSTFGLSEQVGVLQIRGRQIGSVAVNANVYNVANPAGSYGTTIPVLRSDRSAKASESIVISGIRRDALSHTNLYLQETSGVGTNVDIEILNAAGTVIVRRLAEPVGAFAVKTIGDVTPAGGVACRVTNRGSGSVNAFATPVDDASGDTWALPDWNRMFGLTGSQPMLIPVAGAVPGANNTYFRTDVAITNAGTGAANVALRYVPQTGTPISKSVPIARDQTVSYADVVVSAFNATPPTLGFIVVTPPGGSRIHVTSRTYTTVVGQKATYGTGVPTLPATAGLRLGQVKVFAALDDVTRNAIVAGTPGTFRTNFGLVETSGKPATVRVTARFFNGRPFSTVSSATYRDFTLAANELKLLSGLLASIFGESRETQLGDLHNVQAKFEVIGGDGTVLPFITTTDNGSGDTLFRLD